MGTFITYPLDVLRVRLALIPKSTWMQLLKEGRFYQGLTPTIMGIVPYSVCMLEHEADAARASYIFDNAKCVSHGITYYEWHSWSSRAICYLSSRYC